ncbi:MAG TPA: hypothetical protein VGG84_17150, partial [Gemmatimonadaceae bacterium]
RAPRRVHGPTRHYHRPTQENYMKRLALVAAVLVAACSTQEKKADTAAPAMAPAPAPAAAMDTAMKHDSAMSAKLDTAAKKADTAAKKIDEAKGAIKNAKKKP